MDSKEYRTNNEMPAEQRQEPLFDNNLSDDIIGYNDFCDEQMEKLHQEYIKDRQVEYERWSATSYFLFEWFRDEQYDNVEEYTNKNAAFGDWQDFDYAEKLKYVDHVSKCYYVGFHDFCPENTFFSIKPNGLNDKVAYNKWAIDHWRFWLHRGKETFGYSDFHEVYQHIDVLEANYIERVGNLSGTKKNAFIIQEMDTVKDFIIRSNVTKHLVEEMIIKFNANLDDYNVPLNKGS